MRVNTENVIRNTGNNLKVKGESEKFSKALEQRTQGFTQEDSRDRYVKAAQIPYEIYSNISKLIKVKDNVEKEDEYEENEKVVKEETSNKNPVEEKKTEEEEKTDKEETNSDIIVRADGSKVLVVDMKIGSMQSTMSIEISKPTDLPNGKVEAAEAAEEGKENTADSFDENVIAAENSN